MISPRRILLGVGYLSLLVSIMSLQIGLLFLLPYPYNKVNVPFAFLSIMILLKESGSIVWLAFLVHFLIELYTVTPFGVVLSAGTMAFLAMYWLYRSLFTNRTIWAALAITLIGLILYRALYSLWLVIIAGFDVSSDISWQPLFLIYFWELLFTLFLTAIFYAVIAWFTRRFNVTLVKR